MLQKLLQQASKELSVLKEKRKVIFPEGENQKIQEVALRVKKENLIEPILCFNTRSEIPQILIDHGIKNFIIVEENLEQLGQQLYELRKNKIDLTTANEWILKTNFFATMKLKNHEADCLVGGIDYATKDILSPALQIIKTIPGVGIACSANLMIKGEQRFFFTDISLNIDPTSEQLASIAKSAINLANSFGFKKPQVAMLSFSTNNSAQSDSVAKVAAATKLLQAENLDAIVEGEMQFDAALIEEVRKKKMPETKMKGSADIFVFPNLDAGNIGYKIAERLAGFNAVGPMILGLNQVVSDLSRGASVEDIYLTTILTAWRSIER